LKIMKTILLISFLTLSFHLANGQNFERVNVSSSTYYLAVKPQSNQIRAVLVLLDGFGGSAEQIFPETKLHNVAYRHDILTVGLGIRLKISADKAVVATLDSIMNDIKQRYQVPADKFVLGGFSAGGTIALRYTEYCKANPTKFPINPAAVFAVDAPIDVIDLMRYFDNEIKKNFSPIGVEEARVVKGMLTQEYGDLKTHLKNYIELSPFYNAQVGEGNERFLKETAVRVYHDLDINWYLKNRRRSFYDENMLNNSEMINRLLLMGNQKAEFMVAKTPGYRSDGTRHPHSWSIVDEMDCILWIKRELSL
jgi:pimeloyl-ACP methyl ester carboxylesterase